MSDVAELTTPAARRFVHTLLDSARPIWSVRDLAALFSIAPTTLTSRFVRAGLPTPRTYCGEATLVRLAEALHPTRSLASVSRQLGFSSPQHVSRLVLTRTGLRGAQFRQGWSGPERRVFFLACLVRPYLSILDDPALLTPVTS